MASSNKTRRRAVVGGLAAAAGVALLVRGSDEDESGAEKDSTMSTSSTRMPVVYLPHGGGPWPFVDLGMPQSEIDGLANYLRELASLPKRPPKALLVVSAHWEETVPTVMTGARPPMLYDYYGFPEASYEIQWPAPGDPALAERVQALLGEAGFESGANDERGFDHGTFVPLKLSYPNADVPTVQLSLKKGLDPAEHLAMGRALASLRDEDVFILGSGMSYHNMRGFRSARAKGDAETFDAWLGETTVLEAAERDGRLAAWAEAPAARAAHPREEHLLPLMVIAGAAGADRGSVSYSGEMFGKRISAMHFG